MPDAIDLWLFDLDAVARARGDDLGGLLSEDECVRAAGYTTPSLARRFEASRDVLRIVLGCRTGMDPGAVAFEIGPTGKPRASEVPFSASRCDRFYVVAVSDDREIGVDLERARPDVDIRRIGRRIMSPRAVDGLQIGRASCRERV